MSLLVVARGRQVGPRQLGPGEVRYVAATVAGTAGRHRHAALLRRYREVALQLHRAVSVPEFEGVAFVVVERGRTGGQRILVAAGLWTRRRTC